MSNSYYNHTSGVLSVLSLGSSALIRAEYDLIEDGFDLVAALNVGRGGGDVASNVALGASALAANTNQTFNTAIGSGALALSTAYSCTAVGANALGGAVNTGVYNTALGFNALQLNTGGDSNVAAGYSALRLNDIGDYNVAMGRQALGVSVSADNNTAMGYLALGSATAGNNTAIGQGAGYGTGAGALTSGSNNTFVGYRALPSAAAVSNEITLGNASVATLRCQVTSITALSDARDKTHVRPLPHGLDFTNSLRPVAFTWNTRDGAKVGIPSSGFIAQDLQAAQNAAGAADTLNLVYDVNPDKLEATYGHLIPVLVKAIQELSAKVEALENDKR